MASQSQLELPTMHSNHTQPRPIARSRTLRGPADAAAVASHGDGLSLRDDVLEEFLCTGELPAVDRLSGLASVLEGNAEVRPAGASRLRRGDFLSCVSHLNITEKYPVSNLVVELDLRCRRR